MPAITKALRQPSSVPTRPNRNDSDAPMVKELVYQAAMRARVAPSTPCVSARSPGIYMPAMAMPAKARNRERREQTVAQRHAEAGQRAQGARGEIDLPGGPAIGQADQRDDGEHIAGRDDPGEPAGLRVGQRPGLDELRQQRRNNRESGEAEDFGGAYGGNNRCRRCSRGGLSRESRFPMKKTPVGGTGVLRVDDRAGGNAIDRLVIGNTASARPSIPDVRYRTTYRLGDASEFGPEPRLRL